SPWRVGWLTAGGLLAADGGCRCHARRCRIVNARRAIRVRNCCTRRPGLRLTAIHAERRRFLLAQAVNRIRVVVGVADAAALRIDEANRSLEETRLGHSLRHGAFEDIQTVL